MKKKILIIIVLLIVGVLIYQGLMLNKYKSEETYIKTESIFDNTLNVENNTEGIEVLTFGDMNYGNFFDGYEESAGGFKVKRDSEGEVIAYYSLFKDKQYIKNLSINAFLLVSEEDQTIAPIDTSTEENMQKYLDKNNIKNDIDLLKHIKDNYYFKNHILTCSKTMRNHFILNSFATVTLPSYNNIELISGSLEGYMLNMNRNIGLKGQYVDYSSNVGLREIHLLHNDDQYTIVLYGEELASIDFVNNFLSSISFN